MTIVGFSLQDKLRKVKFFEIFFFTLHNTDIYLTKNELISRSYMIAMILSVSQKDDLTDKRENSAAILNKIKETFIVHIIYPLTAHIMAIYPAQKTQIALLLTDKASVATKNTNFAKVFPTKVITRLFKYIALHFQTNS